MIICICRAKSDKDVNAALARGVTSIRDFQRCGIGDQCGSCHVSLKGMIARTAAAAQSAPCTSSASEAPLPVTATTAW